MKATQHHQFSNHPGTSSSTRPSLSLPSIHSSSCWWPLSIPRRPPTPVPPCSIRPVTSRASPVARTRAASPGPMSCSLGSLPSPQPCPHSRPRSSHPPGIRSSCREISPLFDSHRKQNFGAPSQADGLQARRKHNSVICAMSAGLHVQAIAEDDADLLLICLWIKFFLMATKYICWGKLIAHESDKPRKNSSP
ncbi:hypothetical protein EJB05_45150 [Eragrostis curvula]|uniref:Uncharacterized protein n=1 Tax=Eragrostis curvula TaxID=38414 RepID=A0A5J9TK64_9POAL|nr:hypothetical protein EJB05_45150 [Eragrostis curvula]